jgi:hypothetical protein
VQPGLQRAPGLRRPIRRSRPSSQVLDHVFDQLLDMFYQGFAISLFGGGHFVCHRALPFHTQCFFRSVSDLIGNPDDLRNRRGRLLRHRFQKLSARVAIRILANAKHIMENAAFARSSTFTPSQKIEMSRIEPHPPVEFDLDGSAEWLKRMDQRRAEFLCTIEWSWSAVHERMESYYLQRSRTYWILWRTAYDDNWGKWENAIGIARCPWAGLGYKDAAMILFAAALAEERRRYDPDLETVFI